MKVIAGDRSTPPAELVSDPRFTGLLEAARALQPRTVALRRLLHKNPELGLDLPHSQAAVLHALEGLDLRISTGTACSSVVAVLDSGQPGPTVLLRGDMDALPLQEDSGLSFTSEVAGSMHACGHDTHTAMLVSAARLLHTRRDALAGRVVFMFQPGEEGHHGARYMIDEGVLDAAGQPVERAFALHITSTAPSGVVCTRPGPIMAAADSFLVRVTGRGGHGALPEDALDPVPAAAAMVGALHTMVTRRINAFDPAVLTVARITAGTTTNVIPESAELEGTVRTMSQDTRALLHTEITRLCEHIGAAHGCRVTVKITEGYPPTINDDGVADRVLGLAGSVLGASNGAALTNPVMAAEDFSYVLQRVPGALAFLGACPPDTEPAQAAPNHSNRVHFDESAFAGGVATYAAFALDALREPVRAG
ncbi:MAG TPA: M20 family metallopeptidase [Actinophytocola sp.]|uniref:M20 metallopeptidase family protein n=1 Tax=Actinophytocola sp. TaxID=1872138 RepID=UPI002DC01D54|nr:M20 family metallopeptidase [Actinophytocola sp.]HEU5470835.1 M20 family metallopeptidase [Actinophytocola sp.]